MKLYEGPVEALWPVQRGARDGGAARRGGTCPCAHYARPRAAGEYIYIYVLILLYMCPNTAVCVSSYSCVCVLILLYSLNGTLISP